MAKYCDSVNLEHNWFLWIAASKTPQLEEFRRLGVLWSKPLEYVCTSLHKYPSPTSKSWSHCVAVGSPFYFASESGVLLHDPIRVVNTHGLIPQVEWLNLDSAHDCLRLDEPFLVQMCLIPSLIEDGYIIEQSIDISWGKLIADVHNTCTGVARKFMMTEEDRSDLVQETIAQIIRKLQHGKLIYQPGKAPVFNLLTTTIHRCMFSILNKGNRIKKSTNQLAADIRIGAISKQFRSFRLPILN